MRSNRLVFLLSILFSIIFYETSVFSQNSDQSSWESGEGGKGLKRCYDPETKQFVSCSQLEESDEQAVVETNSNEIQNGVPANPGPRSSSTNPIASPCGANESDPCPPTSGNSQTIDVSGQNRIPIPCGSAVEDPCPQAPTNSRTATNDDKLESASDSCEALKNAAVNECNEQKNSEGIKAFNAVNSVTEQISNVGQIQQSCNFLIDGFKAANMALGKYMDSCGKAADSCTETCKSEIEKKDNEKKAGSTNPNLQDEIDYAKENIKKCTSAAREAGKGKVNSQINLQNIIAKASVCKAQSQALTAIPDICQQYPNLSTCKGVLAQNCADPQVAALNPICICQTNASDPKCLQAQGIYTSNSGGAEGGGYGDLSSLGAGDAGGGGNAELSQSDLASMMNGMGQGKPGQGGSAEDIGGKKQGRGLDESGGGGRGGNAGANSAATPEEPKSIFSGFRSGGGILGFFGIGNKSNTASNEKVPQKNSVDLNQFRPNLPYQPGSRGLAGVSGSDGITGPHSSLWEKVTNRYRYLQNSLLSQ